MPFYTVQQTIATVDNVAANYATNVWHIEADAPQDLTNAISAITSFYTAMRPLMSGLVRQNNHPYKVYNDSDPEPRAPVLEGTWNFASAPSGGALPPEVAMVLSFQGSKQSGVNQARRRGRVYIPFINTSQGGSDGRPIAGCVSAIATAGGALLTASNSAAGWSWLTFSRVAPGYASVVNGWVDNEWDTQRRRGRPATSRTTF